MKTYAIAAAILIAASSVSANAGTIPKDSWVCGSHDITVAWMDSLLAERSNPLLVKELFKEVCTQSNRDHPATVVGEKEYRNGAMILEVIPQGMTGHMYIFDQFFRR